MKSFKQYKKDIAPYFKLPNTKMSSSGYPGSNTDSPPIALIDSQRYLDEPATAPQTDTNMYSEEHEYAYHQWTDQHDNEDEYKLPEKLHKAQGTDKIDWENPDIQALHDHTRDSSTVNRQLFRQHISGRPDTSRRSLDNALEKHKLPEDMHVYSGVQFDPGYVASHHEKRHIHLPAYTSTSISKEVAAEFASHHKEGEDDNYTHHHVIHFHLKKGQHGAYVGANHSGDRDNQLSEYPHEHEFILPRNTRIHIGEKPDVYNDDSDNRKYFVHHAHVVE